MRDIDQIIRDMSVRTSNPIGFMDASTFVVGMRKLAEEGPSPATAGMEGPFTVPVQQAVELIAQMVANEFKTQVYYIYYANMLRGLNRGSIAEEFMAHAEHELEHATYLLRRMSVLSPGGITIPSYPPPEPLSDPNEIVHTMIVVEQQGLAMWRALLDIMGDSPMKFTIEQFLQREEEHQDELWQLVEAPTLPEMPTPETMGAEQPQPEPAKTQVKVETTEPAPEQKVASILTSVLRRKQASAKDALSASLALALKENNADEALKLREQLRTQHGVTFDKKAAFFERMKRANFGVEAPMPEADAYLAQEKELAAQQAMAESAHARTVAMQASQAAQQAQAEAQAAQAQLEQAQQQVEMLGQQVAQGSQQSMMATQQAAEAEARAAEHSISKMQLGMRINQVRQQLANMVMQDPVAESAATVSDLAAQGQPATPMQQEQAMAQEQAAAQGGEGPPSAEAQEQVQEAESAQQNAQEQTAEAQQAVTEDKSKGQGGSGTHVTVKTALSRMLKQSGISDAAASAARSAGTNFTHGVGDAIATAAKKHQGKLLGGAAIGTALAAGSRASSDRRRREDIATGVAEGVHRASKLASMADRRMARAIMDGEKDELGKSLIDMLKRKAPAQAAQAAAGSKAREVVDATKNIDMDQVKNFAERLRPHLPAFGVGAGVGALAHKAVSPAAPQQPQQIPPYYIQ